LEQRLTDDSSESDRPQGIKQWMTRQPIDFAKLKRTLLQRLDLSDLDVHHLWQQLRSLRHWTGEPDDSKRELTNTIWLDVEDYLLHAYPWELEQPQHSAFKEVLYDPNAAADQVRSQLETFGLEQLIAVLQQRQDLTMVQSEIAQRLERDRLDVLEMVRSAERQEQVEALLQHIENYLKTTDKALLESSDLDAEIDTLLRSADVEADAINAVIEQWKTLNFKSILQEREDLKTTEVKRVSKQLKKLGEQLTIDREDSTKATTVDTFKHKLESYLRYTNPKQLTPEHVERKLKALVEAASHYSSHLVLPALDFEDLKEILERRQAIDAEQIEQILQQILQGWQRLSSQSQTLAETIQSQSNHLLTLLIEYIKRAANSELTQAEFTQGLLQLLTGSALGWTTRKQLSELDWQALKQQLSQIELEDTQIDRLLRWTQAAASSILKSPRRWASRRNQTSRDLLTELENYLRYNRWSSFTPETIANHLKLVIANFSRPLGWSALTEGLESLSQLDAAKIQQFLLQRADAVNLNSTEIDTISETIASTLHQVVQQLTQTRSHLHSASDFLAATLSDYWKALNLSSFDYDRIKVELHQLLGDPQWQFLPQASVRSLLDTIPLDQWGESLAQLSYEALTTSLQSINPLPALSEQLTQQAEGVKSYVLTQVETVKAGAVAQVDGVKQSLWRQAEETRKAIVVAAWWLFGIAFSSAIASATAGALAVMVHR
jgi:hypothetical protein